MALRLPNADHGHGLVGVVFGDSFPTPSGGLFMPLGCDRRQLGVILGVRIQTHRWAKQGAM